MPFVQRGFSWRVSEYPTQAGMYSAARVFALHTRVSGVSPQNCMKLGMVSTCLQSQLLGGGSGGSELRGHCLPRSEASLGEARRKAGMGRRV